MESQDSGGLQKALDKAYAGEWKETPIKRFHFSDTVEEYLELYSGY